MKHGSSIVLLSCVLAMATCAALRAHESPVERVARMLRLWTEGDQLRLRYEETYSERSALLELHAMDANGDGTIQDAERFDFLTHKALELAAHFRVHVANTSLQCVPVGRVGLRRGWRQVYDFSSALTAIPAGTNKLQLVIRGIPVQPGEFQWTIGRGREGDGLPRSKGKAKLRVAPALMRARDTNMQPDRIELDFVLEIGAEARDDQ